MTYNTRLAERIRAYLADIPELEVEEKEMFKGLVFMVNGKMCINVSGDNLMCRFDPKRQEEIAAKAGFEEMIMRGKEINGYCYINPDGLKTEKDFEYFVNLCLDFNKEAKASKKTAKLEKSR